jgi:hypothetical protein
MHPCVQVVVLIVWFILSLFLLQPYVSNIGRSITRWIIENDGLHIRAYGLQG